MRASLVAYIEAEILPRYAAFDKAHREDHARSVISRALEMGRRYDIDEEVLYTAAAYHDLGLAVDRKTHHLESGKAIRADRHLLRWFTPEQVEIIAQAAEDHRASAKAPPRSIYGALVAEADRMIVPEIIIRRTVQFGLSHYPELDKEGHWERTLAHLNKKYAEGGYLHLLIPGSPNEEPLQRLREIIRDEAYLRSIFETCYLEETKTMIDDILLYNKKFVAEKGYEPYVTDKFPAKKLAVLTCMDTRLTELLPKALGLQNGDAKIIKNAGGVMLSERDSAIRSLLVAIYELGVNEVMVVHHSGCGACHMGYAEFKPHMLERGISAAVLSEWEKEGIGEWLEGFHDTEASVRKTVAAIVSHPLMPSDVTVRGFVIDSVTGALTEVK